MDTRICAPDSLQPSGAVRRITAERASAGRARLLSTLDTTRTAQAAATAARGG